MYTINYETVNYPIIGKSWLIHRNQTFDSYYLSHFSQSAKDHSKVKKLPTPYRVHIIQLPSHHSAVPWIPKSPDQIKSTPLTQNTEELPKITRHNHAHCPKLSAARQSRLSPLSISQKAAIAWADVACVRSYILERKRERESTSERVHRTISGAAPASALLSCILRGWGAIAVRINSCAAYAGASIYVFIRVGALSLSRECLHSPSSIFAFTILLLGSSTRALWKQERAVLIVSGGFARSSRRFGACRKTEAVQGVVSLWLYMRLERGALTFCGRESWGNGGAFASGGDGHR